MSEPVWNMLVEEHWTALEARPTTGEHRLRVSHLPVTTGEGPIAAAVDQEGHHHLLVPVNSRTKVRSGLDGPVLRLRKRPLEDEETYQTYADLACLQDDFEDLFTK
ncbi:PD-(D/E)XK motif protein, partial [Streptomyces sp. NPDC057062]